jgi:hypothetical protein
MLHSIWHLNEQVYKHPASIIFSGGGGSFRLTRIAWNALAQFGPLRYSQPLDCKTNYLPNEKATAMNEWDQRIRKHSVWGEMQSLGPTLDTALNVDEISPDSMAGIERLRAVLSFCGTRLAAADPFITTVSPLDEVAASTAAIRSELVAFASDRNPGHIVSANSSADRALVALNQIPGSYSPEELGSLVEVSTEYRKVAESNINQSNKAIEDFRARADAIQVRLNELAGIVQIEQSKLSQISSDYQGQFSVSQEKRNQEYTSTLRLAQQELTKLVTEYQGQFSAGQDARSKEFAEAQGTRQTKYSELSADYDKRLSAQDAEFTVQRKALEQLWEGKIKALSENFESAAGQILEAIREKEQHVEKLVGVIGNLGVTSGYLRRANQALITMRIWQGATLTALIALSVAAYRTLGLLEDSKGAFSWGGFAGRVLLLTSFGVIAAYCGSQADKLFTDEKRNRKLALELEAIGPYLAPLPIDEQNKFRLQMGELSFGKDHEFDSRLHGKSPVSVLHLLKSKEGKEVFEMLTEIVKRVNDAK